MLTEEMPEAAGLSTTGAHLREITVLPTEAARLLTPTSREVQPPLLEEAAPLRIQTLAEVALLPIQIREEAAHHLIQVRAEAARHLTLPLAEAVAEDHILLPEVQEEEEEGDDDSPPFLC